MRSLGEKVQHHFRFSLEEIRDIAIGVLIVSFIFGFDDGREVFELGSWLGSFITVFIIVLITFLLRISVQKIAALGYNYRAEFKMWIYGLLAGVVVSFISGGRFFLALPGGIILYHMAAHRLGEFRYGLNNILSAMTASSGSIANILFAFILKILNLSLNSVLLAKVIHINLWLAILFMLPIPPLDGSISFFGGRSTYFFIFSLLLAAALMIAYVNSLLWMLIGTLILGVALWVTYYLVIERIAW